jgi:Phasin protein
MSGSMKSGSTPFDLGTGQTAAMTALQKELMEAYEQAGRSWLARVQSEVDLWSEMGKKLSATRSAPEAMQVYQECVTQRMRMAAEDGQKISEDCQKLTQKIARSLSNGWPGDRS